MFKTFTLALVCAFLCGCGKADDQGTKARAGEAQPVRRRADTTTNTSTPFDITLGLSSGVSPEIQTPTKLNAGPAAAAQAVVDPAAAGEAIVKLPDGTIYEGESRGGKANGQGIFTDGNGRHQEGEWRDGLEYRVAGTLVFPDGTKEVGTWNRDGTPCGGTIIWKDGRQYEGGWKLTYGAPELPDGQGEMTWPDGRKYVGLFHDGAMDGPGKMTWPDGKVEDGTWNAGKFIGGKP